MAMVTQERQEKKGKKEAKKHEHKRKRTTVNRVKNVEEGEGRNQGREGSLKIKGIGGKSAG